MTTADAPVAPLYEQCQFAALSVDFDCTAPTARMEYIKTLQELLSYYNIHSMLYENAHFTKYKNLYTDPKYNQGDKLLRWYVYIHKYYLEILNMQMKCCYFNYSISTLRTDLIKALCNPQYAGPYLYNYTICTPQYMDYIKQYKCDCADQLHHNRECCSEALAYFNILDTTIAKLIAQHSKPAPPANTTLLAQIAKLKTEFATYVAKMHNDIDSLASAMALT
jgi:hypothetical protein